MYAVQDAHADAQFTELDFSEDATTLPTRIARLVAKNHMVVIRNFPPYLRWDSDQQSAFVRTRTADVTPLCK